MTKSAIIAFTALTMLMTPTISPAKSFGEHGGYDVIAIETYGETAQSGKRGSCGMTEEFKGPGSTRLILVRDVAEPDFIYMVVDNYNWSITKDQEYAGVTYAFSNGRYYERAAIGVIDSIHKGFLAAFPYSEFIAEFRKAKHIDIHRDKTVIDELSLEGSGAATLAFERCWAFLRAQDAAMLREWKKLEHIPTDPFAVPKK